MDSTRSQHRMGRTPARHHFVTEEEERHEDDFDDVWPARPPHSARRYQELGDVHHEVGRAADIYTQQGERGRTPVPSTRHTIPPRRTATQKRIPAPRVSSPSHVYLDEEQVPYPAARGFLRKRDSSGRRPHWLVFVGLTMLVMILGWLTLSALGSWWQITQDDWHYGRPRTFQIDEVVGHRDSQQNPSHFIAMNLNRHIIVIEIPGGDPSKSVVFNGPTLSGPGQDLAPVTLSFADVNHDGKKDMIITVQGNQFIFLNENATFVPANQNPGTSR